MAQCKSCEENDHGKDADRYPDNDGNKDDGKDIAQPTRSF